jgi:hypothetical protein
MVVVRPHERLRGLIVVEQTRAALFSLMNERASFFDALDFDGKTGVCGTPIVGHLPAEAVSFDYIRHQF